VTVPLTIAFLPLTDCATLAVAKECGFAEEQGLALTLVRETSWATVRDRLVYGQAQAAHMLAPLAVGVSLGLSQHRASLVSPFKLSVNGILVVLSRALAGGLPGEAAQRIDHPGEVAAQLAAGLRTSGKKPVLGVVHRFSSHALMLRYWLASADLMPDRDYALRVLPPSLMGGALAAGEIDGFCAGEPWGSAAVIAGAGEVIAVGTRIWQRGVEKLLTFRSAWAETEQESVDALLRACDKAAAWCDNPANRDALAALLSRDSYVARPVEEILPALSGNLTLAPDQPRVQVPDVLLFHKEAANFPWRSQGLWIYSQLVRWGFIAASPEAEASAASVFRPDIYRRALAGSATPMPGASAKLEGALDTPLAVGSVRGRLTLGADRFFDGRVFDPDAIADYLASF
jgi:ABC-type nitrate/sulfonate/bicarbonate transport system substrate-binding protein